MAGDEVGAVYIISGLNGGFSEAQVRDRYTAGLFGVVCEVALNIEIRMVAYNLNGVLVRTNGSVGAESPEHTALVSRRGGIRSFLYFERKTGNVVVNADGERGLAAFFGAAVNGDNLCGSGVLAAETVAASVELYALELAAANSRRNIEEQRFAHAAGFLGAVKHGYGLCGMGNCFQQVLTAEGTVEANLNKTVFAACGVEIVNSFLNGIANGAHGNDNMLRVSGAIVVKELVVGADFGVDLVHILFHNRGKRIIKFIAGFACLEENIRVLCGSAGDRVVGVESIFAERFYCVEIRKVFELFIVPYLDFLNLVGGSEAVKEMDERNAALNRGKVGDGGEIHNLLRVAGAKHGKAGLTAGVNVGMIAENAQCVGSKGACGNVNNRRKQLARHFIHIRNHKKQSLRSGECGGKRSRGKRAVNGTGGAGFGLHLHYMNPVSEDIGSAGGRPFVGKLRHYR